MQVKPESPPMSARSTPAVSTPVFHEHEALSANPALLGRCPARHSLFLLLLSTYPLTIAYRYTFP